MPWPFPIKADSIPFETAPNFILFTKLCFPAGHGNLELRTSLFRLFLCKGEEIYFLLVA